MASSAPERAPKRTTKTDIIRFKIWEAFLPPPLNSWKGALVPRSLLKHKKRRKISVEVHRVYPEGSNKSSFYEEAIVRVLEPVTKEAKEALKKRTQQRPKIVDVLDPNANSHDDDDEDDDDQSIETAQVPNEFLDDGSTNYAQLGRDIKGWKAKYRLPLKALSIKAHFKKDVVVHMSLGKAFQIRQLVFDSVEEADNFRHFIQEELSQEEGRADMRLKATLGSVPQQSEQLTLLVEIVSAWNLLAGDFSSSDPYVRCTLNGVEKHRTKYIPKTLDPIWTLKTDSLFLLTVDLRELFLSEGLLCTVYDFDKIGTDEILGSVYIPPKVLRDGNGERLEFKLAPPPNLRADAGVDAGYLAIRVRKATEYDQSFMKEYKSENKGDSDLLTYKKIAKEAFESAGGKGNIKSILTSNVRTIRDPEQPNGFIKQYKVRPGPDPKRVEETTWMTKEQIEAECVKDSHCFVDSGSGRLGRLFVEVLGCDDLPNLDTGGFAGNKTDTFVCIVFEDTAVTTDIIDDCLNPRWMPWSKRAFIFQIYHSSSQMFLGVFDYDQGMNPADEHDLVGRVSIDLSNLRKDTVYTLKYNMYTTARMSKRKRMGTVTVRLRLEVDDERQFLLSSLEPPPHMYVNNKKWKDFRVIRYTCTGRYDMEVYSMKVINSYIEELLAMQHVLFYVQDAALALVLWRGTFAVQIGESSVNLPVHSATAFVLAVFLVEHPRLLPSFFLFGVAWLLLATMDYRRQLPDVWSRCKSFAELFTTLVLGKSNVPPANIEPYYKYDEAQAFLEGWKKRISDAEEKAAKAYEESVRVNDEYAQEMEALGEVDTDLTTKRGGMSIDPFKPILFPVQQNLAMICRYLRHVKYVIFWEECYISFWVVTGCLILAVIFLFVPWLFIMKWTFRIVAWTIFGPWMKLVDVYYVSKIQPPSEEELEQRKERERAKRRLATSNAVTEARIKREQIVKTNAFKKFMFGKYVTRVPVLKEDRYRDLPLPESMAHPYRPDLIPLSELAMQDAGYRRSRLPGQHLVGDMIPRVFESHGFTDAPIGQATAHPRLLEKTGLGGGIWSIPDSTVAAYTKIATLVLSAGVMTWLVVPMLSAVTESILKLFGS